MSVELEYLPRGRNAERRFRKHRHRGFHGGNVDARWLKRVNRDIRHHHYAKWWVNRRKDTAIKWMTLYHNFFRRFVENRIERRKLVAKDVEKHLVREHYGEAIA